MQKVSMPVTLIVLLILMGLGIVGQTLEVIRTQGAIVIVALVIQIGLVVGIFLGSEAVRTILIAFAVLGLAGAALNLLRTTDVPAGYKIPTTFYVTQGLAILSNAFTIFALTRMDVQQWMFQRKVRKAQSG